MDNTEHDSSHCDGVGHCKACDELIVKSRSAVETDEDREARIERESVEWVFGLTGGELEDKPWEPFVPKPDLNERDAAFGAEYGHPSSDVYRFTYWYEGVPDYAGRSEFPDMHDAEYRTVVKCFLLGNFGEDPPEELRHEGCLWRRVAMYTSSGETECPLAEGEDGPETVGPSRCPYCEADPGDEHGYIYLGDGWAEVVYRREPKYRVTAKLVEVSEGERMVADMPNAILVKAYVDANVRRFADDLWANTPGEDLPDDLDEAQCLDAFREAICEVAAPGQALGFYMRMSGDDAEPFEAKPITSEVTFLLSWERI